MSLADEEKEILERYYGWFIESMKSLLKEDPELKDFLEESRWWDISVGWAIASSIDRKLVSSFADYAHYERGYDGLEE